MRLLLRRYGKTAAMAAASFTGGSPLLLLDCLLRLTRVLVLLSIWRPIDAVIADIYRKWQRGT